MSKINDLHPTFTRFAVEPYTPTIGAVIHELDLRQPLDATTQAELRQALAVHEVLFFRDQHNTPQQQVDFTRSFGNVAEVKAFFPRLENHPEIEIVESTAARPKASSNWHADITWREQPPLGTSLYAQVIPASGGDTLWASGVAAYAALSAPWRRMLAGLNAEHDFLKSFPAHRFARTPEEKVRWDKARNDHPPRLHPVVRTHPVSGAQGLFVSEGFTTRIVELGATESDAVLRQLFAHISKPEFTVRWRWKVGDLAFWDNRCTQHYAVQDYWPAPRKMERAAIIGDKPF